ncbi:MAG: AAA family ATPase [Thermoproteota archaeon]
MIDKITIRNFRSIKDADIQVKPITILYGPNSSGKSSVLYAFFILKNIVLNPNQPVDSFLNLVFSNLGGFVNVVFNHEKDLEIELGISKKTSYGEIGYFISFDDKKGNFRLRINGQDLILPVSFPYPLSSQKSFNVKIGETPVEAVWNGVSANPILGKQPSTKELDFIKELNSLVEEVRRIDIVPLRRGFNKPSYSPVQMTPVALLEDEVAYLMVAPPGYLLDELSSYIKRIFNKDLRVYTPPGTAMFYIRTLDETGLSNELVNEGFGVNQTVYMLAKILRAEVSLVAIEEPEIHLHPSSQAKLVETLIDIAKRKKKRIILSTHSEHIVGSLLTCIADGKISPEDVACYFLMKDKGNTIIREQKVNQKGQIEGGLTAFIETEVDAMRKMLGI